MKKDVIKTITKIEMAQSNYLKSKFGMENNMNRMKRKTIVSIKRKNR